MVWRGGGEGYLGNAGLVFSDAKYSGRCKPICWLVGSTSYILILNWSEQHLVFREVLGHAVTVLVTEARLGYTCSNSTVQSSHIKSNKKRNEKFEIICNGHMPCAYCKFCPIHCKGKFVKCC